MKLYVVSGLGADFKVLEKIKFPSHVEVVFLDWIIPEKNEDFKSYIEKMAARIDDSEPFYLLGYSFGGIIVQEIDKIKPAEKVVILGCIKSNKEMSGFLKANSITKISRFLPTPLFNEKSALVYAVLRKFFDSKNPMIMDYFAVRNPYYLKWSIEQISKWKFENNPKVIQILGEKDIIFPPKYSKPNYIIARGTHLFPATRPRQVSTILASIFS